MRLWVPQSVVDRLKQELSKALRREIGGVLVGEKVDSDQFRIADLSVQQTGGSAFQFVRNPAEHRLFLEQFFDRTGHDYERFNYLGEWHSHPHAIALPSHEDEAAMRNIVGDSDVGVHFALLLISRLGAWRTLQLSATAFTKSHPPEAIELVPEPGGGSSSSFRQVGFHRRRRFIRLV